MSDKLTKDWQVLRINDYYSHNIIAPPSWAKALFKDICQIVGGSQPPKEYFINEPCEGYIRLIQIRDYKTDKFATYIPTELAKRFCSKEDIMIGRYGPPIFQILRGLEGAYNVALMKAEPNTQIVDKEFLYYFLQTSNLFNYIAAASLRTAGQDGVRKDHLDNYPVFVPPLNEQKRIVTQIEALKERSQKAKAALEAIPELCDRFRQSVLAAAFRGDLTADWREQNPDVEPASVLLERIRGDRRRTDKEIEPLNPARLPEIPTEWSWVTVEHLGMHGEQTVLTGPFGATLGREDFVEQGTPVITIGCLQERGLDLNKAMYVKQNKADELGRYKLKAGDFLFSRMASVGRAAIVQESFSGAIFNYHLMRLRLAEELIEPRYFLYYIRGAAAVFQYVKDVNHGATRDGINTQQLNKMPVALPPIKEQHQIVALIDNYFERVNSTEDAIFQNLSRLDVYNQSILAKAFRGELVEQDPNDEPASVLLDRIRAEREAQQPVKKSQRKGTAGRKKQGT